MCNAWNHSIDCTCGFGGEGHKGGGGYRGRSSFGATPDTYFARPANGLVWRRGNQLEYDSFTIPNARCPECGALVFFYQSPYGGRVFFDSLGPPWPKHPCTDNWIRTGRVKTVNALPTLAQPDAVDFWKSEGWRPLSNVHVEYEDGHNFITAKFVGSAVLITFRMQHSEKPNADGPFFFRLSASGVAEISYISFVSLGGEITTVIAEVFPKSPPQYD